MTILLLSLSLLSAAAFAGFVLAMATVVHQMLCNLTGTRYHAAMRGIIVFGRASLAVRVLLLTPLVAALVAVVLLLVQGQVTTALVTALGWVCCLVGPLGVSRLRAEPLYDEIMLWQSESVPADWLAYAERWRGINFLRGGLGAAGAVLLLVAALSL